MKGNKKTKQAADLVDVRKNGDGTTTYRCLQCGFTMESNVYYEANYRAMLKHAASCQGTKIGAPQTEMIKFPTPPRGDIETFNTYIRALAGHIKNCVPNGHKLNVQEAIALARISIDTGLSPYTGELFYLPGKGPHIGIAGLRRKAKEQSLYSTNDRPMTPEENEEHNVRVEEGEIGYICLLWRHDVTQQAAQINRTAGTVIISIEPVRGIGIYHVEGWQSSSQGKPYPRDPIPNGRSAAWVARKRSHADALIQSYDVGISLPYADEPQEFLPVADDNGSEWHQAVQGQVIESAIRMASLEQEEPLAEEDYSEIVDQYQAGRKAPPWLQELRAAIKYDDRASDPVDADWIDKLVTAAEDKVSRPQFEAFVQIALGHRLEEMTFGEVRQLKPTIDKDNFAPLVAELLKS